MQLQPKTSLKFHYDLKKKLILCYKNETYPIHWDLTSIPCFAKYLIRIEGILV